MSQMSAQTMQLMNMGMSAVSGGISGLSQWKAGSAERTAYDMNARIELEKTAEERFANYEKYARLSGQQRLLYAQAGVALDSGSPLLVMMDTAMDAAISDARINKAGKSRANLMRYYGDSAATAGRTAGLTTFLTTIGKVGNQAYQYAKENS